MRVSGLNQLWLFVPNGSSIAVRVHNYGTRFCILRSTKCISYLAILAGLVAGCAGTSSERVTATSADIACWGDSLTYSAIPDGQASPTWPQTVANDLGVSVYNGGVAGQGSAEIATRQGGLQPLITLQRNEIAGGPAVALPVAGIVPASGWRRGGTGSLRMHGSIAGVVGTLRHILSDGSFTFTPDHEVGRSMDVPPQTPFISDEGGVHQNQVVVLWTGTNSISEPEAVERDIAAMVTSLTPFTDRFLVVSNTLRRQLAEPLNRRLMTTYGNHYANLRGYLIEHGLADADIAATPADTADVRAGNVPSSLRWDDTHFNQRGYDVIGRYFAGLIAARKWI